MCMIETDATALYSVVYQSTQRCTVHSMQPVLPGRETTCVSTMMYAEAAERVREHSELKYCACLLQSPYPTTPK